MSETQSNLSTGDASKINDKLLNVALSAHLCIGEFVPALPKRERVISYAVMAALELSSLSKRNPITTAGPCIQFLGYRARKLTSLPHKVLATAVRSSSWSEPIRKAEENWQQIEFFKQQKELLSSKCLCIRGLQGLKTALDEMGMK